MRTTKELSSAPKDKRVGVCLTEKTHMSGKLCSDTGSRVVGHESNVNASTISSQ